MCWRTLSIALSPVRVNFGKETDTQSWMTDSYNYSMHSYFFDWNPSWNIKVIILANFVMVDLATPAVSGGIGKYLLMIWLQEIRLKHALWLLCQKLNRRSCPFVYSAAKQIMGWEDLLLHNVLIKTCMATFTLQANVAQIWFFQSSMDTDIWFFQSDLDHFHM